MSLAGIDETAAEGIVARRRSRPYGNVYELLATLPRDAREWIQADVDGFMDGVAFGPRELEVASVATVEGSPVDVRLRAVVYLHGGRRWELIRISEE